MIIEIISLVIFAASIAGILGIVSKKMPSLAQVQAKPPFGVAVTAKQEIKNWCRIKIKSLPYLRDFSWLDFAQKILLKAKVVALKSENKVNDYIVKLRNVADNEKKKDEARLDNYWHELKTIVKSRNPLYKRNLKTSVVELDAPAKDLAPAAGPAAKISAAPFSAGPEIRRVALPQSARDIEKNSRKRRAAAKKKRSHDPFQW